MTPAGIQRTRRDIGRGGRAQGPGRRLRKQWSTVDRNCRFEECFRTLCPQGSQCKFLETLSQSVGRQAQVRGLLLVGACWMGGRGGQGRVACGLLPGGSVVETRHDEKQRREGRSRVRASNEIALQGKEERLGVEEAITRYEHRWWRNVAQLQAPRERSAVGSCVLDEPSSRRESWHRTA